jgi:hypothetical protein
LQEDLVEKMVVQNPPRSQLFPDLKETDHRRHRWTHTREGREKKEANAAGQPLPNPGRDERIDTSTPPAPHAGQGVLLIRLNLFTIPSTLSKQAGIIE